MSDAVKRYDRPAADSGVSLFGSQPERLCRDVPKAEVVTGLDIAGSDKGLRARSKSADDLRVVIAFRAR